MTRSEKFSMKISDYIKKTLPDKTEEELEIIRYGLEVVFMNFTKLPIILGLGYLFGIFKYTVWTVIIFGIIRKFGAGIHARKSYTCLMSTMVIIFGGIYISMNFTINILVKTLIFIVSIIVYFKYSPADTEEKPYLDPIVRKKLKIKSIITIIIYFFISINIDAKNVFLSNILINILWIEGVLMLPITYKILKRRYNNYEYYKESF